ncbi:MAG: antiporter [Tissierellia bacterium]|nr:antiporter [Tissierellia bacterium]
MKTLTAMFLIMAIGYFLGSRNIFGIKFGASAILITALFFGHFGVELPSFLSGLGLVLFLTPIGLMAGPDFIGNIKKNGVAFLLIALITCVLGGVMIAVGIKVFDLPTELSLGLGSGALTSTAMLGSVNELTDSLLPGVGYGIAYAFGVLGVVLFVQLVPRFLKADVDAENAKLVLPTTGFDPEKDGTTKLVNFEPHGLFPIALAIVLGTLLGGLKIPVGKTINISLGNGGGSLIMGIVLGHMGHLGPINFTFPKKNLQVVRDLGLALFLMQAGAKAGAGFIAVLAEYGIQLFLIGVLMTLVPATVSFIVAYKVFKLPLFAALGTTTGSMTSAPSLGALLSVTNDDKVASFYAACQPVATIMLVFLPQIISIIFGIN